MADKTALSRQFTLTLSDGTKVPKLQTLSTYELGGDGFVRDANVKLLKLITELEYKSSRRSKTSRVWGSFGVTMFDYYAILAERPPGRGSDFEYNDEVLDKISLPKRNDESDAFGPPIQPTITFKRYSRI